MTRTWLLLTALAGGARPALRPRRDRRWPRRRPRPRTVVRDQASAPPELRELAASVDFTRYTLVTVERMRRFFGGPVRDRTVHPFDGTVQLIEAGGVVELPAVDCDYCGGATPPAPTRTLDVIRVPRFDGELFIRARPVQCTPCDPRVP